MVPRLRQWKKPSLSFYEFQSEVYGCPRCPGALVQDALSHAETRASRQARESGPKEWTQVEEERRFVAIFVCNACDEVVTMAGRVSIEEFHDNDGDGNYTTRYENLYQPAYIAPAPRLFEVPPECPRRIVEELERSFMLFWVDLGSSANALRGVAELVLDHEAVPKSPRLNDRLDEWQKRPERSRLAEILHGTRVIGNSASHPNDPPLSRHDLYDAFTQVEVVLHRLWISEPMEKDVHATARSIVDERKPRSHQGT